MLKFNGVTMPDPSGITFAPEKIWSANAGRGSNGDFSGDLIAIKMTSQIQWPLLTPDQIALIDAYASKAEITVTYLDPRKSNQQNTGKFYAGTPSYPVYSYAVGKGFYQGVALDLIEI